MVCTKMREAMHYREQLLVTKLFYLSFKVLNINKQCKVKGTSVKKGKFLNASVLQKAGIISK